MSRLDYDCLRDDLTEVLNTLEPLERRVTRRDGSAHDLLRILPYSTPDSAMDGSVVTFVDVTRIVQAEEHQRLLVDELNHRVKNMLSAVISLATQTLRRSGTLEEFEGVFLGRVHALTAAYALLSSENWSHVQLKDVEAEETRPFMASNRPNIRIDGPAVRLDPRAGPRKDGFRSRAYHAALTGWLGVGPDRPPTTAAAVRAAPATSAARVHSNIMSGPAGQLGG